MFTGRTPNINNLINRFVGNIEDSLYIAIFSEIGLEILDLIWCHG